MSGPDRTIEQLVQELAYLSMRILNIEKLETERKKTEEPPMVSEQQIRKLIENINDVIYLTDNKGVITYISPAIKRLTGYEPWEVVGKPFAQFIQPDDLPINHFQNKMAGHVGQTTVCRGIARDGKTIYIRVCSQPIIENGKPMGVSGLLIDITEQKASELKLHESQQKLQALVEITGDFLWEINLGGVYTYCSPQIEKLWGFKPSEMLGKTLFDLLPPGDKNQAIKVFSALSKSSSPFTKMQINSFDSTGQVKLLEISAVPFFDNRGQHCGYRGITRDITDRKPSIESIRVSDTKYKTLFECMPIGIIVCNKVGNIMDINKEAERLLGVSPGIQTQRRIDSQEWQLIRFDGSPMPVCEYAGVRALKENRVIENVEVGIVKGEGVMTWVNVIAAPIPLTDYGVVIAYNDVSSNRRAAEELLKEKQFSDSLINTAQIIIVVIDDSGRIIKFNPYMERVSGYLLEEVQGKDWISTFLPIDIHQRTRELFHSTTSSIGPIITKDGKTRYIEWNNQTLKDAHGEIVGLVCIGQDITEGKKMLDTLKNSEAKYRTLFESATEGILIASTRTSNFLYANPAICKMLGYGKEELKKLGVKDIHPKDSLYHIIREFEAITRGEKSSSSYIPCLKRDGTIIYVDINSANISMDDEDCNVGFFTDITERKRIEETLKTSEVQYRRLFEASHDAILILNGETGQIMDANPSLKNMLGFSLEELLGKSIWEIGVFKDIASSKESFLRLQNKDYAHYEHLPLEANNGRQIEVEIVSSKYRVNNKKMVQYIIRDITERIIMEQKLVKIATHDYLTDLPNRVLLMDHFNIAAALARRNKTGLAIMSLDLDKFKSVNDTLGHNAGDQVLKIYSSRLSGIIRASDTVARIGGDEFILLISEIKRREDATAIAQKILDSFIEPLFIDGHQLHLSTSIGIAIYPENAEDMESLLKKSDAALYYCKEHGRNQFKFFTDGDDLIREDIKRGEL